MSRGKSELHRTRCRITSGDNAVKCARKEPLLTIPTTLAIGDAIQYVRTQMQTEAGMGLKYTFSGTVYFERMQQRGLYSTDIVQIEDRVQKAGMSGIFG